MTAQCEFCEQSQVSTCCEVRGSEKQKRAERGALPYIIVEYAKQEHNNSDFVKQFQTISINRLLAQLRFNIVVVLCFLSCIY